MRRKAAYYRRETTEHKRVGYCCGCRQPGDQVLYKIPGLDRWRCAACYKIETGYDP